ncbi:MAG TPA: transglutaminase family protein, partial [Thermoanaerobaculia bacterium]
MTRIRQIFRRSRWSIVLVLLSTFSYSVEANNFAVSYRVAADEEARLEEMAKRLGVPVEKLRREQPGLIAALRGAFTNEEEQARQAGLARVEAQLRKMSEQVAANPYRAQIDEVKNAYKGHRLDGLLRDLTQLGTTEVLSLPVASRKALLKNVRKALEEDLEPHVPEDLPGKARGRHDQLRGRLNSLYAKLRKILDEPDAISDAKLAQTLGKLAAEVNQEVRRTERGPRFKDRPLPLQLREQTVATQEVTQPVGAPSSAMVSAPAPSAVRRLTAAALPPIPPEIAALAQSLGGSPARIFAHVHDNVRYDPKWGAVRSPLGTLQEGEGTSWDQAWLLQELLTAAGVDARVEWGQVEIPTSLLLTLTGTSDPFDAGNLISTGGVPAVLLVQGGKVVGARIGHVWVKAHLDYVPNRGVTQGTADTWVRMDPTLKRYGFAEGIDVHSQVPFDLGAYLQSGTELSPRRAYEDALFAYIRANNIDCANLEQLKKAAQVVRERFPFVPGTLRGKILRVDGEQAAVPEAFQQRLNLEVKTAAGASLLSWSTPAPAVYGKRVEIDYLGATSEDQATLDAYGGVFETPPYLVDLKPVVKVAGAAMAQGGAVGSAADTEVWVTMTAPTGPPTIVTHVTSAGERHVLAADFGEIPQAVLDAHQAALSAALAAGNSSEAEAEILFLVGAQYLHNLGRDLTDLSGWKWQRLVRLGTEGLITQTGVVTTTVGGAPISFRRGQRNVDIALMPLGMVPADGRRQFRREAFELLGAQSSFLEGEVFNQVLQREGIASVSALTLAKRQGQTLSRVDGANVDAVLAQADLGADAEAEIRAGVARGRIAWVAQSRIAVQQWRGTGYVIEDPDTGAAAYLISGGFAG